MPAGRLHTYLLSPYDDTALRVNRRLFIAASNWGAE